jgi:hypothetical protein
VQSVANCNHSGPDLPNLEVLDPRRARQARTASRVEPLQGGEFTARILGVSARRDNRPGRLHSGQTRLSATKDTFGQPSLLRRIYAVFPLNWSRPLPRPLSIPDPLTLETARRGPSLDRAADCAAG